MLSQLTLITLIMMTLRNLKNFIEFFLDAFAVQARELTQSQTILQNQIENIWHIFKQGAMVIQVLSVMI